MRSLPGSTAVITGASQGLGTAIARRLGNAGFRLALVARNAARLRALQQTLATQDIQASIHVCDLANSTQLLSTCNDILSTHDSVDLLINNAGVGGFGNFSTCPPRPFSNLCKSP